MILAAALALLLSPEGVGLEKPHPDPRIAYSDPARDIVIRYDVTATGIEFSGKLPAQWTFHISVDGDANGQWGMGPSRTFHVEKTADWTFAMGADGGYCPQYIFTANPDDTALVYASSECSRRPSRAQLRVSRPPEGQRRTIIYAIPDEELFGTRPDAHVQICVWDTQQTFCEHGPTTPFIVPRPTRP